MYSYEWYQWLAFFYIYCFFGWIFESAYVSFLKKRFVNRGFLHLPLLPLYGTGAVMMLWVSLPVKDNLFLVYAAGVIAATILEYVTGWGMEKLFKVKYWDYSDQRFQLNGYICLSSSIAWGFLTILLTEVIHRPIEAYVLGLPTGISLSCVCAASVLFAADTVRSVKEALDLAGGVTVDGPYVVINGGPMMGKHVPLDSKITKTTKGLIVLPESHPLIQDVKMDISKMLHIAKAACCHCSLCTEVCPRNLIGHRIAPNKTIRFASYGHLCDGSDTPMIAFLCSECRLCQYACIMNLQPWKVFLLSSVLKIRRNEEWFPSRQICNSQAL